MKLIIAQNTYPAHPNVPHAEPGDVVRWEAGRRKWDGRRLIRVSDGRCVFVAPAPSKADADGNPIHGLACGVVAQIKSRGWRLVVGTVEEEQS